VTFQHPVNQMNILEDWYLVFTRQIDIHRAITRYSRFEGRVPVPSRAAVAKCTIFIVMKDRKKKRNGVFPPWGRAFIRLPIGISLWNARFCLVHKSIDLTMPINRLRNRSLLTAGTTGGFLSRREKKNNDCTHTGMTFKRSSFSHGTRLFRELRKERSSSGISRQMLIISKSHVPYIVIPNYFYFDRKTLPLFL